MQLVEDSISLNLLSKYDRGHEWRKFDLSQRQKLSIVGLFGVLLLGKEVG